MSYLFQIQSNGFHWVKLELCLAIKNCMGTGELQTSIHNLNSPSSVGDQDIFLTGAFRTSRIYRWYWFLSPPVLMSVCLLSREYTAWVHWPGHRTSKTGVCKSLAGCIPWILAAPHQYFCTESSPGLWDLPGTSFPTMVSRCFVHQKTKLCPTQGICTPWLGTLRSHAFVCLF